MLNARTWHRLCVSSYLAFPVVVVAGVLPKDSLIIWLPIAVIAWAFLVGIFGAIQGVILAFGRLYAGCPVCNAKSSVTGGDRDGMYLDCPRCGRLRLKLGRLRGLQAIRPGSKEDGLTGYRSGAVVVSPLVAPIRYFIPFTIIFIPVVASIVAASIIYKFTFFYLIIPGFFCYGIGGFLLDGVFTGRISDNHGTAVRSNSPFRFWRKIAIWLLFYILVAASPIGIALQESAKTSAASEHPPAGDIQKAVSDE